MPILQQCRSGVILLVIIISLITGCKSRDPVKIGFLGCLSGRNADLGVAGLNGVMLAVEKANLAGGINGSPIEIIAKDDEHNPEIAVRQVESLIKSGVKIIIGPMTSNIATAVLPTINKSGTILISPTVTSTDFSGKDDNFLRVCGNLADYATKSALYQTEQSGKRKAAVILDDANGSYSEKWLGAFKSSFEANGGSITDTLRFTSGKDKIFLDTARKALAGRPDLLLVIANAVDASSIVQQVRKLKPDMAIAMSEWAATERFIELAGKYSEGVIVSQFIKLNDTSPNYVSFINDYKKRFELTPLFPSLTGYDATGMAIKALALKGTNLKESIISTGRFQGVQEVIKIDRHGDSRSKTYLSVIRDRSYQPLE